MPDSTPSQKIFEIPDSIVDSSHKESLQCNTKSHHQTQTQILTQKKKKRTKPLSPILLRRTLQQIRTINIEKLNNFFPLLGLQSMNNVES